MAVPAGALRVSLIGYLDGGEEFDTSFWLTGSGVDSAAAANTAATTIADSFEANSSGFKGLLDAASGYSQVKVYAYPSGGTTATYVGTSTWSGVAGNGAGTALPLQTCCVVTLGTGFSGRRYRGRMYIPVNKANITAGQFTASYVTALVNSMGSFFNALNAGAGQAVVVVSQTGAMATPVTSLKADTKPDTQRRRAASLAAATVVTASVTA